MEILQISKYRFLGAKVLPNMYKKQTGLALKL